MSEKNSSAEKLQIKMIEEANKLNVRFFGIIDEDAHFDKLIGKSAKKYFFHFGEVKSINSCGIREWVKYLNSLSLECEVYYEECPQNVIEQMGMVHGFIRDNATIESFFAPYFCEKCDQTYQILLKSTDVLKKMAPKKFCLKDNSPLEFDAIDEQYFSFIRNK